MGSGTNHRRRGRSINREDRDSDDRYRGFDSEPFSEVDKSFRTMMAVQSRRELRDDAFKRETQQHDVVNAPSFSVVDSQSRFGEWEAKLFGLPGAEGKAVFEIEPEDGLVEKKFTVKLGGVPADSRFAVKVDDFQAGFITVDASGEGYLELTNDPDDPGELPLPGGFPNIAQGTIIQIGDILKGVVGGIVDSEENQQHIQSLEANLFGGGMRGRAEFEIEREDGFLERKFSVAVRHGTPGEQFSVEVNDVLIGDLTFNRRGRARLELTNRPNDKNELPLPENFPDLSAGSIVEIGNVARGVFRQQPTPELSMAMPDSSSFRFRGSDLMMEDRGILPVPSLS